MGTSLGNLVRPFVKTKQNVSPQGGAPGTEGKGRCLPTGTQSRSRRQVPAGRVQRHLEARAPRGEGCVSPRLPSHAGSFLFRSRM